MKMLNSRVLVFFCFFFLSVIANAGDFLFGVGTHFPWYKERELAIKQKLMNSSFNAFRDEFSWNSTERKVGTLAISPTHQSLSSLTAGGQDVARLSPILILGLGDVVSPMFPSTIESMKSYVDYAKFIVKNNPNVNYFELGNEWNIGGGIGGRKSEYRSEDYYLRVARSAVPEIKVQRRGVKIISAGLGDKDNSWLSRMMAKGGKDLFDGVALHPYNFTEGKNATPERAYQYVKNTSGQLRSLTNMAVPIYITEMGWPNNISANGFSLTQADSYSVRFSFLVRSISDVKALLFYDFVNDGKSPIEREHNFGMLNYDLTEKPIFKSMNCIAPMLIGGERFSYRNYGDGVLGVSFEYDGRYFLSIWNESESSAMATFNVAGPLNVINRHDARCADSTSHLVGPIRLSADPLLISSSSAIDGGVVIGK